MSELSTETPVLEAREVRMRFGGLLALDGVSVAVPPGRLVGLVGPNGSGKSTLFAICSGLLQPTDGRILVGGSDVTGMTPQARTRMGLARTFQQPEMFTGLTVREHFVLAHRIRQQRRRLWTDIFTGASLRPTSSEETEAVDGILDLLALSALADEKVDVLPLGTARLVEVGRALATKPSVVLLDEPLAGLDSNEAARVAKSFRQVVDEQKISLLLVEHDVSMVLGLCSWIYVLDFGQLIAQGTPEVVRSDAAVKAAYLGEEPVSSARHREGEPASSAASER